MDDILRSKFGNEITIIIAENETEGTVGSLAEKYIDNDLSLSITTLDMYFEPYFDPAIIDGDGTVLTFEANNPAYSYSKLGEDGYVIKTAEKR